MRIIAIGLDALFYRVSRLTEQRPRAHEDPTPIPFDFALNEHIHTYSSYEPFARADSKPDRY